MLPSRIDAKAAQLSTGLYPVAKVSGPRSPVIIATLLLAAVLISNDVLHNASASDEQLVELLHENLASAGIDDSALTFTELDGVVTLIGRVASEQDKANIIDLVQRTYGVIRVVDEISTDY